MKYGANRHNLVGLVCRFFCNKTFFVLLGVFFVCLFKKEVKKMFRYEESYKNFREEVIGYIEGIMEGARVRDIEGLFNDAVDELIGDYEVVYYGNAMEFLMEHDASLRRSMELARDVGYSIENVDSEVLATLLLQNMLYEGIHREKDEIIEEIVNRGGEDEDN